MQNINLQNKDILCYKEEINTITKKSKNITIDLILLYKTIKKLLISFNMNIQIPPYIKNDNQIINNYLTSLVDNSMDQHIYAQQYFTAPILTYVSHICRLFKIYNVYSGNNKTQYLKNNEIYNYIKNSLHKIVKCTRITKELLESSEPISVTQKSIELMDILNKLPLNPYQLHQIFTLLTFKIRPKTTLNLHTINNNKLMLRNMYTSR